MSPKIELSVEQIAVSHSLSEFAKEGSPGISGQAFTSWTIKRKDGVPMSIEEAKYASIIGHLEVKKVTLTEAVARNVMADSTAKMALTSYVQEVNKTLAKLSQRLGYEPDLATQQTTKIAPTPQMTAGDTPKEGLQKLAIPPTETKVQAPVAEKPKDPPPAQTASTQFAMPEGVQTTTDPTQAVKAWLNYHFIAGMEKEKAVSDQKKAEAVTHLKVLKTAMGDDAYKKAKEDCANSMNTPNPPVVKSAPVVTSPPATTPVPPGVGEVVDADTLIGKTQ